MRAMRHMPFGAEPREGGGVRFRLWAPAVRDVALLLEDAAERPMIRHPDGWFALDVAEAAAGARYRYRIDGDMTVPDPASRFQPGDVHGPSEVIDPMAFEWPDDGWCGRPWEQTVIYELHVGCFTPGGRYEHVISKLDEIVDLGVTAIELMPLADSPGARNWGYDGVYLFAPDARHGRPEDLKRLIAAAHARGLMVFLDVVYNHFGPEGNYLHCYAPAFFTERYGTPWGAAINFDGPHSRPVRDFFIENALFWIEEYRIDGLRFDAVHAIFDDSDPHILPEIAGAVRRAVPAGRFVHLVLENDDNAARYLAGDGRGHIRGYDAQWNDDAHHAMHVLLTDESEGYYADYAARPAHCLARVLAEGFAYQGEPSPFRDNASRGEASAHLPPTAFVSFLQNHDQVGNRAFGERIDALASREAVEAALAVLLLSPQIPLLFMGEEWASLRPFLFFCDFGDDLAGAVRDGRRREFARFARFRDPAARARIPDPNARSTFDSSMLDWSERDKPAHRDRLMFVRDLLTLRHREIVPRLANAPAGSASADAAGSLVSARWPLAGGTSLHLRANLGARAVDAVGRPQGRRLFVSSDAAAAALAEQRLPPWSVAWHLDDLPQEAVR